MLENGQGGVSDPVTAMHWYGLAAEQGHASAQYNLARLLLAGVGGERDVPEAIR